MSVHLEKEHVSNSKCYLIAPRSGEGARVSVESGGVLWQETDGGNGGHCQKHIRILWWKVRKIITLAMLKLKRWPGKHVEDEDKDSEDKNTASTTLKERLQGRRRKYFQRRRPSQVRRGGESEQGCPWIFFCIGHFLCIFVPQLFYIFCIRCFLCFSLFLSKSFRGVQIGIL